MTQVQRAISLASAPVLAIIVYWRAFVTWFANDDFGWLGLRLSVGDFSTLLDVLFEPQAQGTVRVLSERLLFLVLPSLFGINALPFRIVTFVTLFAALWLVNEIGTKLTGSRFAGIAAALIWVASPNLVIPLTWASAYNQILCSFLLLAAFYSHLRWLETGRRKWIVLEWVAYIAGFGALELTVMYPAIVLLYHACAYRRKWASAIALAIPAAAFTAIHLFLIPKTTVSIYAFSIDSRLISTLAKYVGWTIGPSRLGGLVREWLRTPGYIATVAIGLALLVFAAQKLRRREWIVLFCAGWFALLIAPVAPLANHITDYYVTIPSIGFAWLAGWAIASAWQSSVVLRAASVILTVVYFSGSIAESSPAITFFQQRSERIHRLLTAMQNSLKGHEDSIVVIRGVDNDLFHTGFQDDPFRLLGASKVYLAPGTESGIAARADLGGLTRFRYTNDALLTAIEKNRAIVLEAGPLNTVDITERFRRIVEAEFLAQHRNFVDVGNPMYAARLGPTWYPIENGFRWMPKVATVMIAGPKTASEKLWVSGYAAAAALASGPVTMHFRVAGKEVGKETLTKPNVRFEAAFPIPADLIGQYEVEVAVEAGKTFTPPSDRRELGMIFGTFAIK